jgi:hypothetical protein
LENQKKHQNKGGLVSGTDWSLLPQDAGGHVQKDYFFDGRMILTTNVATEIHARELSAMLTHLLQKVEMEEGLDYLAVFEHRETGKKVFVIDQLSRSMLEGGDYSEAQKQEYHYFTVMFSDEY